MYITVLAMAYAVIKTVLWWAVSGTLGLLLGRLTLSRWGGLTLRGGLFVVLGALAAAGILLLAVRIGDVHWTVTGAAAVCALLSLRVFWREVFTLFGLLSGDWSLSCPRLRFFGWGDSLPSVFGFFGRGSGDGGSDSSKPDWGYKTGCYEDSCRHMKRTYGHCYG